MTSANSGGNTNRPAVDQPDDEKSEEKDATKIATGTTKMILNRAVIRLRSVSVTSISVSIWLLMR